VRAYACHDLRRSEADHPAHRRQPFRQGIQDDRAQRKDQSGRTGAGGPDRRGKREAAGTTGRLGETARAQIQKEKHSAGKGLGCVDVHLLASAAMTRLPVWILDGRLQKAADVLRVRYRVGRT